MKSISISNSIKKIDDKVFCGCDGLSTVHIPDGVKIIGKYAFQYCKRLNSIIIPESVELIEENAFDDCDGLEVFLQNDSVEIQSPDNVNNKYQSSVTLIKDVIRRIKNKRNPSEEENN